MVELRSYVYLDRLQPNFAAFLGANLRGFLPAVGMAAIFMEIAPGLAVNEMADAALKAAFVQPGILFVERSYGFLEFHSRNQGDVRQAGEAALKRLGMDEHGRIKPRVLSSQIIHKVNDYHAQVINVGRQGSLLLAGQDLYVMEVAPAAYVALAANEAEKNAQVSMVDVRLFGAAGRLYVAGRQADVERAMGAAEGAIASLTGVEASGGGQ